MARMQRLALIGLGRMGRVHARALRTIPSAVELVAVAEPDATAVMQSDELLGSVSRYERVDDALAHPDLDGCVVATPTDTHVEIVEAALRRRLHVFCEKPLTLDLRESERLGVIARERGLALQVGFWRRFSPALVEAKRLLADGAIGRPIWMRCVQWDVDCPPAAWCDPRRSGGVFVDMAIHEFDQLEWLAGTRATAIEARTLDRVKEDLAAVGDFDNAIVLLRLATGAQAVIEVSRNGRYADDVRMEVLGSDGAIMVNLWPEARVRLGTRDGLRTVWGPIAADAFLDSVGRELLAFSEVVAGRREIASVPGPRESIRATTLGEAARTSADAGGAPVMVSEGDLGVVIAPG